MKKLFVILALGVALWMAQNAGMLPFHDRIEAWQRVLMGGDSKQYTTFQQFATAMVRGEMDGVARFTDDASTKKRASDTYLGLRRLVRDVHRSVFRLDEDVASPDGRGTTLTVSQAMTIDAVGVHSAFGTLTCEARYIATMIETPTGWKVASFTTESSVTRPEKAAFTIGFRGSDAEWPCADSPWSKFATSWKEKVLGTN